MQRGSWDCQRCTFHNEPYAKVCEACEAPHPPQVLAYKSLPPLRFGLELEFIIPNGQSDGFTLEYLEQAWNSAHQHTPNDPTPRVQFLSKSGAQELSNDHWTMVPDASLQGDSPDDDLYLKLVSPVLQGEKGHQQLRQVMERLLSFGISTFLPTTRVAFMAMWMRLVTEIRLCQLWAR